MRKKAMIFDMDGVLIDSEPAYQAAIITCFQSLHISISRDALKPLAGGSDAHFNAFLTPFAKKAGLTMKQFNALLHEYSLAHPVSYPDLLNPGVHETLQGLRQRGITLALASSSPIKNIQQVVKDCELSSYFSFTISGEAFHESKPNPEIYLTAIQRLGYEADEIAAVEDSTYGIEAAKRAGLYCFGKRDDRFDYRQDQADELIDDLQELLTLI